MLNSKNKILPLPGALVISTYAPCPDIRSVVTPDLKCPPSRPASSLLWVSLAPGMYRVGGSALSQVCMCVVLYIQCMLVKPHASYIHRRATLPCAIDSSQASKSHHRRLLLSPPPSQWGPETPTVRDKTLDVYHAGTPASISITCRTPDTRTKQEMSPIFGQRQYQTGRHFF